MIRRMMMTCRCTVQRAAAEIDQITQRSNQALIEAGIDADIDVFLLVPNSGQVVLSFGTMGDPPDDLWDRVSDVVVSVLRDTTGLKRTRCRQVVCASTGSIASGHRPVPVPEPALQHTGFESR